MGAAITAGLALLGCPTADGGVDASAHLADAVPTVVVVEVAGVGAGDRVIVEFGAEDGPGRAVAADVAEDGVARATLLGLPGDVEVHWHASVERDGALRIGEPSSIVTGPVPTGLPALAADDALDDAGDGWLLTSFVPGTPVILDGRGRVVWWHDLALEYTHYVPRLLWSRDRRSLLYLVATNRENGGVETDKRMLVRVSLDGADVETTTLPSAHHDLVELPDGALATLMYDARTIDGEEVVGDRLVELRPDGSERELWSIWDHVDYDPEQQFEGGERWGHCNALQYDEGDDAFYLSSRNFSSIFKIARDGTQLWRAGRGDGDFTIDGGEELWFENQHGFRAIDGGLLVFDNGVHGGLETGAVEIALDVSSWTAAPVWRYQPDPPTGVYAFGDVERLPSGHTLVNHGAGGRLEEVDEHGEVLRRLDVELGAGLGYMRWLSSLDER